MQTMIEQFKAARRTATPILAVRTPDPAATQYAIMDTVISMNTGVTPGILHWDAVSGLREVEKEHKPSVAALEFALKKANAEVDELGSPVEALKVCAHLPEKTLVFFHNAQRVIDDLGVVQAVWNLRDRFKLNKRTLVLLCPEMKLPPELVNDVVILDEPLPRADELKAIVRDSYEAVQLPEPDESTLAKAVDALVGLAAFPAEQVTAMSLTETGLDMEAVWERKRQAIEQHDGLSVWRGGETFADVAGCENVKRFIGRTIEKSKKPIRCVLWLDEIEKAFAGLGSHGGPGDNTGVTQDQLKQVLSWWEDKKVRAILLTGFAGTGKSLIAKATGGEAGVPTIQADLGAMKGGHVGDSEARLRAFIKVVEAMAPDGVLAVATCNNVHTMPPELLSRFRRGQFFFDLPDEDERRAMWAMHIKKNDLSLVNAFKAGFDDSDWTGREIEACCTIAADLDLPLVEAAKFVVPVAKTMGENVDRLRKFASGRFLSASQEGTYGDYHAVVEPGESFEPARKARRAMSID